MADSNLIFLAIRGQRFIHLEGKNWRSWCRVCGFEYVATENRWGTRSLPMTCPKHRDTSIGGHSERHHNAKAGSGSLIGWNGERWVGRPAPHLVSGFGYYDHLPEGLQPSYSLPGSPAPAAPRRAEIEEPDSDT